MKSNFTSQIKYLLLVTALSFLWGCRDNDEETKLGGLPKIEMISASVDENGQPINPLVSTELGYANNTYIITGSGFTGLQHIYFNDLESYFNPNFVTDKTIIVTINENTPYVNGSNKLKLVTRGGTVEHDFIIAPPAPQLKGFNPVNSKDGSIVTVTGNYFVDPIVTFGDLVAEIESVSLTQMKVKLPDGAQDKKMTVKTISGTSTWDTAVGSAIFDDKYYGTWQFESWNNHEYVTDPAGAYQGEVYIKKSISGWDNLQSNWNYDEIAVTKYTGIQFAVKSEDEGKLQLIFNGDWSDNTEKQFTTGKDWKIVKFTWDQLGNPAAVQNISFKEFTGSSHEYYFDNFTYTID